MSEFKNIIISIIIIILWSFGMFGFGYLLSDRRATERIESTNIELAKQQQKYDELVRSSAERVARVREELSEQVSNNGKAATELSKLVEQIGKQKLNI